MRRTVHVSMRMEPETAEALTLLARHRGTSASAEMRAALRSHLEHAATTLRDDARPEANRGAAKTPAGQEPDRAPA